MCRKKGKCGQKKKSNLRTFKLELILFNLYGIFDWKLFSTFYDKIRQSLATTAL